MNIIVAVDDNWGIGKNNSLLFRLPQDLAHFKQITTGNIVVMGSNTLKSLPKSRPLPDRINIVLWPDGEDVEGAIVVRSLEELSEELAKIDTNKIFIIGGAMLYKTMLPYCEKAYVTKVFANGEATLYFENLDISPVWTIESREGTVEDNGYTIQYYVYKNNNVKKF